VRRLCGGEVGSRCGSDWGPVAALTVVDFHPDCHLKVAVSF
jgi:hypothetical protein